MATTIPPAAMIAARQLSALEEQTKKGSTQESATSPESPKGLTDRHIAKLWERMAMIYGHKWVSTYGVKDDGTWLAGLKDISVERIAIALDRLVKSREKWPPSLPEFRDCCFPTAEALGIPNVRAAYKEAVRNSRRCDLSFGECEWSHAAVYHAAIEVGSWDFDHLPENRLYPLFQRAYEITVRKIIDGGELPPIPKALPVKSVVPKSEEEIEEGREFARKCLKEMKEVVGVIKSDDEKEKEND